MMLGAPNTTLRVWPFRRTRAILWRTISFFVLFGVLGAVVIVPVASKLEDWKASSSAAAHLYPDFAGLLAILAATWIMTRFVDHRPFRTVGFAPGTVVRDIALGLALGALWLTLSVGIAWACGWATWQGRVSMTGGELLEAGGAIFFNVLTQQLLLCGYIFQTIRSRTNFALALLLSAALFSVFHAGAFEGALLPAVNVFAVGVLFCAAFQVTGNLWLPASLHFAWNFLLGPVFGLTVSGSDSLGLGWTAFAIEGPALFTGGAFGLEGGLVVTLTTGALAVALLLMLHRARGRILPAPA